MQRNKLFYQTEIQQMMFVFGEVSDPLDETSLLVEEITRTQIMEVVTQAVRHAAKRGNKFLAPEDLIFLLRFDRTKVNRLRTYLGWKDVRKRGKNDQPADVQAVDEDLLVDDNVVEEKTMKKKTPKVYHSYKVYVRYYSAVGCGAVRQ
jgi:transcription initiation protein SPT3